MACPHTHLVILYTAMLLVVGSSYNSLWQLMLKKVFIIIYTHLREHRTESMDEVPQKFIKHNKDSDRDKQLLEEREREKERKIERER